MDYDIDLQKKGVLSPQNLLRKKMEDRHLQALAKVDLTTLNSFFDGIRKAEDSSPSLNKEKFRKIMSASGLALYQIDDVADSFFDALDANQNGNVDKKELLVGFSVLASGNVEEKLGLCFKVYDLNKDDLIEMFEIERMIRIIRKLRVGSTGNEEYEATYAREFAETIFSKFASPNSLGLTIDQFVNAAKSDESVYRFFSLGEGEIMKPT